MIGNTKERKKISEKKSDAIPYTQEDYRGAFNLKQLEKDLIIRALELSQGNQAQAAKLLGIRRETMYYKLIRHNIKIEGRTICLLIT